MLKEEDHQSVTRVGTVTHGGLNCLFKLVRGNGWTTAKGSFPPIASQTHIHPCDTSLGSFPWMLLKHVFRCFSQRILKNKWIAVTRAANRIECWAHRAGFWESVQGSRANRTGRRGAKNRAYN